MRKSFVCLGSALVVTLSGCGPSRPVNGPSASYPRPLVAVPAGVPQAAMAVEVPSAIEEPTGALQLRHALALALTGNPGLASSAWDVRAAEARALQAGVIPAPELGLETSEIGGRGTRRGVRGAETTLQLSQLVELGGKLGRRVDVASHERDVSSWEYEAARMDVLLETTRAFVAVLAAQRQVALAQDSVTLAGQVSGAVSERVRAGLISPLEETRTGVALSSARVSQERAERDLRTAREALSAMWGSTSPSFVSAEGDLEAIRPIPPLPRATEIAGANPDLGRWTSEMRKREAALELERSKSIPDPTVTAGVTRFEETKDYAFLVGVSIPLPVFGGLNRGGVREAGANVSKGIHERRAAEVRVTTALAQASQKLSSSYLELTALRRDVLPAAERAFDVARQGYQAGKFGFVDVLDAQRTLIEERGRYLEALTAYHTGVAEVERLTGRPLGTLAGTTSPIGASQ